MLPDPFDVLEVTLGPDVRPVRLDGVTVVRTTTAPSFAPGNAVHHRGGLLAQDVPAALDDAATRFAGGTARVVAADPDGTIAAAGAALGARVLPLEVALLEDVGRWVPPARTDLDLATPADDKQWHGVTVLHRHAGPAHEERGRGERDELLRWWVEGTRQLVGLGRARALRAARFGTPVGAGTLVWEPRVEVDADHAGLAVLHDHVVHPAHRGLGVADALARALVTRHLADFPAARVAALLPPGLAAAAQRRGWRTAGRLVALERAPA